MNKTKQFISSIISLILASLLLWVARDLTISNMEGLQRLGLIVIIPLLLPFFCLMFGACLSAFINSIMAISSCAVAIKIISILLLIASIIATGYGIYILINLF